MLKIVIQGTVGSFHAQAARQFFGNKLEIQARKTFRDVFKEVASGHADYGVVAIENSLHGSINPVYRLLAEHGLWVCGEVRLHIQLFLIGTTHNKPNEYSEIDTVMSQAEAISQCELWLHDHLPHAKVIESDDTAGSVKQITESNQTKTAAIASRESAKIYNATIFAGPINDDPENYTRFFILSKNVINNSAANRTSIIMTEKNIDQAGSLYDALGIFKKHHINLSKLDSHTLPGRKRRYAFYIDFDDNIASSKGKEVVKDITAAGWDLDILGSYVKAEH